MTPLTMTPGALEALEANPRVVGHGASGAIVHASAP
jgi:hypothetical protein